MAYMCRLGYGECDACGCCSSWDEDVDHEDNNIDDDEEEDE